MSNWFDYVEPTATAIATIVAIYAAFDARRSVDIQSRETERQGLIAEESMLLDYHSEILGWADKAIDWISNAHSLTFFEPSKMAEGAFFERRAECLWRLSALIDRGRLFFPNEQKDNPNLDKPLAFRGFRPVVLNELRYVHRCLGELRTANFDAKSPDDIRKQIIVHKRNFVSEVQAAVDPEARESRLKAIISRRTTPKSNNKLPALAEDRSSQDARRNAVPAA